MTNENKASHPGPFYMSNATNTAAVDNANVGSVTAASPTYGTSHATSLALDLWSKTSGQINRPECAIDDLEQISFRNTDIRTENIR